MRIYLDGPFDLGCVYGVGDFVLGQRRDALLKAAREVFGAEVEMIFEPEEDPSPDADDLTTLPYAAARPFGAGLRLRVQGGQLIELWRAAALHHLHSQRESHHSEYGPDGLGRIEALLQTVEIRDVTLFLFGIGAGTARLRTGSFAVEDAADARGLFKLLELGGYGDLDRGTPGAAANALMARFRTRARKILSGGPGFHLLQREMADDEVEIRGYQGVIALEEDDPFTGREDGFYRSGETITHLPYGPLSLGFGWLHVVVCEVENFEVNLPRFLYTYMLARLAWDVSHRAERQFDGLITDRVGAALTGRRVKPLTRADLRLLKMTSSHIAAATTLSTTSAFAGDLDFYDAYEEKARIHDRQDAIRAASMAFADAEEDEIRRLEARRSNRLAALVALLTVVSLVGVAADVTGSWSDALSLFGDARTTAAVLAAPAAVGLLALLLLGAGRRR